MNPFQRFTVTSAEFKVIQRFVILMYSKASEFKMVDAAQKDMFFQKNSKVCVRKCCAYPMCMNFESMFNMSQQQ